MRALLLLLPLASLAAEKAAAPPPPYVLRVLALGHEPERRFFLRSDGFFDMHELDPRELPPAALFLRAPDAPPAPGSREPLRHRAAALLNAVGESRLPPVPEGGDALVIERAVEAPASEGKPPEVRYERLGDLARPAGSASALVILYNPLGRRTWDGVKPTVLDTSASRVPPGSLLLMNLCPDPLDASVEGRAGQLAAGQSALLAVSAPGGAPLELKLALRRVAEPAQLFDSAREMPVSRRALLIVYPVSASRNARGADFILLPLSEDPAPAAPPSPPAASGR